MLIQNLEVVVQGRFPKIARLRNELYDHVQEPESFLAELKQSGISAHIFTFLQERHDCETHFNYYREYESISMLPISSYDEWMTKRIDAKTRNMIRKAAKNGVVLREVVCDEPFIEGVVGLYNESHVRQGMKFWHYGMDFAAVKAHLETFSTRSHFVGAYLQDELIGFYKLTRNATSASLMQIISKISARECAPNNALLAHAVSLCADLNIALLQYGTWGSGGLAEYKKKHGFVRFDVPRYLIPLDAMGALALRCRLHRRLTERVPKSLREKLASTRAAWYARRARRE